MKNNIISKYIEIILNSEINDFKDNYFNGDIFNLEEQFLDFLYKKEFKNEQTLNFFKNKDDLDELTKELQLIILKNNFSLISIIKIFIKYFKKDYINKEKYQLSVNNLILLLIIDNGNGLLKNYDLFLDNINTIKNKEGLLALLEDNNNFFGLNKKGFFIGNSIFILKLDLKDFNKPLFNEFKKKYNIPIFILFLIKNQKLERIKVVTNKKILFEKIVNIIKGDLSFKKDVSLSYKGKYIDNLNTDRKSLKVFGTELGALIYILSEFKGKKIPIESILYTNKLVDYNKNNYDLPNINKKCLENLFYIVSNYKIKKDNCILTIFGAYNLNLLKFLGKNIVDYEIKENYLILTKIDRLELFKIYKSLEKYIMKIENFNLHKDYFRILKVFEMNKILFNKEGEIDNINKIKLLKANLFNEDIINTIITGPNYKDKDVINITVKALNQFYNLYYSNIDEKPFTLMLLFLYSLICEKKLEKNFSDLITSIRRLLKVHNYIIYKSIFKNNKNNQKINYTFIFNFDYNVQDYIKDLKEERLLLSNGEECKITQAEYEILYFFKIMDKNKEIALYNKFYDRYKEVNFNTFKKRISRFNEKDYKLKIRKNLNNNKYYLELLD